MIRLAFVASVLGGAALLFAPRVADACRCAPPRTIPQAYKEAGAVFLGKAVRVAVKGTQFRTTFLVNRGFKGPRSSAAAAVFSNRHPTACGYAFRTGRSYLVYASAARGKYSTSSCSRTKQAGGAGVGAELRVLASLAGGQAGSACGSRGLAPCRAGFTCIYPESAQCGATDRPGTCQVRPQICTREYRPVCGCDGRTYGNRCSALAAGVSVRRQGACQSTGGGEGAACGSRGLAPCGAGMACIYPESAQCGATDLPGTCQPVGPRPCIKIYRPVCGCDGRTYSNSCVAGASGASIKHQGACQSAGGGGEGAVCGSRGTAPCGSGLACIFPQSANCGATDMPGTCQKTGMMCIQLYQPVCGCDGRTYSNGCMAASAGASVKAQGACP